MTMDRQRLILLSPLAVIAIGNITARLTGSVLGVWAWIPLTLSLWTMFAVLIAWGGGREAILKWSRAPRGAWCWSALAIGVGLVPLPILLLNWTLIDSLGLA